MQVQVMTMNRAVVFTPRNSEGTRLEFQAAEVEYLPNYNHHRGLGLKGRVHIGGKLFRVYGAGCGAVRCQCDAVIYPIKEAR